MARFSGLVAFLATLPFLASAQSGPYQGVAVASCCSQLASRYANSTFSRDGLTTSTYNTERTAYWSATEWLDPTCVFLPSSVEQVSTAVTIFNENGCPFAIRGGGHSPIRGAANIDDGILISMKNINDVTISEDKETVTIGTGNTWAEVYETIEPEGIMVVGGRFATVGAGLALAAGFSYLMNEHGMAIDNVVGHRVVLADGSVVEANANENPELHWALKGGSNNFGVVTHMVLNAYPSEGVYGGRVSYDESQLDAVAELVYRYNVETATEDHSVHILPTYIYDGATNTTIGASPIVYNGLADALPESLQPWVEVEFTNNTIANRTYSDLAAELIEGAPNGLVQTHYTFTVYPTEEYLNWILSKYREFCASVSHIQGLGGLHTVMPIPPQVIEIAGENNPLGLNRARPGEPLTVFYLGLQFELEEDIPEVFPAWDAFIRTLQTEARLRDILFPYIMLSYSDGNQQAIASYGSENVRRLQEVQREYDPTLVFQRLVTGGQKVPIYSA